MQSKELSSTLLTVILLMLFVSGCRAGKSVQGPATSLGAATADMSVASVTAASETMDSNLAGYLPDKNEIDRPVIDSRERAEPVSNRQAGNYRASSANGGCQNGCCR